MRMRLMALAIAALATAACNDNSTTNNADGGGGGDGGGRGDLAGTDGAVSPDMTPSGPIWPQFGYDQQHSGNVPNDTAVTTSSVTTLKYAQQVAFPTLIDGAPVYLAGVSTSGGTKDLVFITSSVGTLYALDATTLATVWSKPHGPMGGSCTNASGSACWTTSSPAIDPSRSFVYSYGLDGLVHKHQVGDGSEVTSGGWPEVASLKPDVEKGSSALAFATAKNGATYLYVAHAGYYGDAGDYQGHVTTINLGDGSQHVFEALCSDMPVHFTKSTPDCNQTQTAVWARSGVIYDANKDRIYFSTGNGLYDGMTNWGDSVLAIAADGTSSGTPLDSYTPTNFAQLDASDTDLGSTEPALLPTPPGSKLPHLAVQGGKDANIRLINVDDFSGQGAAGKTGGELQIVALPQGGEVLPQPAVWTDATGAVWVYVTTSGGIAGFKVAVDGNGNPTLPQGGTWSTNEGGSSPIIVGGILYYSGSSSGRNGTNSVFALDPTTGNVLWSGKLSSHVAGANTVGGIHWESPIIVGGKLYVPSENGNQSDATGTGKGYLTLFTL